jgi:glutathione-regulated potassium-efflux system ancillary protein KefG
VFPPAKQELIIMPRILILFAHPLLEKSRVHAELVRQTSTLRGVTFHDLYEHYPEFDVDIEKEKSILQSHDIIIWQHPFYWYSAPALLKQWIDLVLEHGWAYGAKGVELRGKKIFNVITSGGSQEGYKRGNFNKYSIHDFLAPFERTATLCRMNYLPPFWVSGVHLLTNDQIRTYGEQYRNLLLKFLEDAIHDEDISSVELLNDLTFRHNHVADGT